MTINHDDIYKELEKDIKVKKVNDYKDLVCPKNWKEYPFDRWYKLKEAYSSELVSGLLKEFGASKGDYIIDPFLGSGTTLTASRSLGLNGYGMEVNPFSHNLATVKLRNYTEKNIRSIFDNINFLMKEKNRELKNLDKYSVLSEKPKLSISDKVFKERMFEVLRLKSIIKNVEEPITRDFLMVGFGCILERISYAKKDGNGLKYPINKIPRPIASTLNRQYKMMVEDIDSVNSNGKFTIFHGDSRVEDFSSLIKEKMKYSIFSPPYANCFDYTEVYKIELWMMDFITEYDELKPLREKTLSSHLNKIYTSEPDGFEELEQVLSLIDFDSTWGKDKLRAMLLNYFEDMENVFENLKKVMSSDGTIFCVVGNSAYGKVPIATDLFLCQILKNMGYESIEIRVARKLGTSSQQKEIMNNPYLRESIIIASS